MMKQVKEIAINTGMVLLFCAAIITSVIAADVFETQVSVVPTTAITAKFARVEQLSDRVAIFVEGEDPVRQLGLRIIVQSNAKWVAVRATIIGQGRPVNVTKLANGDYLLFGKPATYAITVIESDPDKGLNFTDVEATIVGSPVEPVDPVDPPPVSGDLAALSKIAKEASAKLNDPKTASALSAAYKKASIEIENITSVEAAKVIVSDKRRAVLNARTGESLTKDWNSWLVAIEPELSKHLTSVATYRMAVLSIANSLQ
jgi:thiamine phosphate synthase YjbQ (UPF0047 family)